MLTGLTLEETTGPSRTTGRGMRVAWLSSTTSTMMESGSTTSPATIGSL